MMPNSVYRTKFHAPNVNTFNTKLKSLVNNYTVWKGLHDT